MIYTEQQICNRILRAKCCFADLSSKWTEAVRMGDSELAKCLRSKMLYLEAAISALCNGYVPYYDSNTEQQTLLLSVNITGADPRITRLTWNGAAIVPASTRLTTDHVSDESSLVRAIVETPRASSGYVFTNAEAIALRAGQAVSVDALTPKIPPTRTGLAFSGSDLTVSLESATEPVLHTAGTPFCLTNSEVTQLLGNIDEICGCPCGCGDIFQDITPNNRTR